MRSRKDGDSGSHCEFEIQRIRCQTCFTEPLCRDETQHHSPIAIEPSRAKPRSNPKVEYWKEMHLLKNGTVSTERARTTLLQAPEPTLNKHSFEHDATRKPGLLVFLSRHCRIPSVLVISEFHSVWAHIFR